VAAAEAAAAYRNYIEEFARHMSRHLSEGARLDLGSLGFWSFPFLNLTASPP
jgi:hypothetical protein